MHADPIEIGLDPFPIKLTIINKQFIPAPSPCHLGSAYSSLATEFVLLRIRRTSSTLFFKCYYSRLIAESQERTNSWGLCYESLICLGVGGAPETA